MWDLDDANLYIRVLSFTIPEAFTYGDTRPEHTDRDKREQIRDAASANFPAHIPDVQWWAFRIFVKGNRTFDIDNVPKLIVDAFCKRQIKSDKSSFKVGLYDDDTIDYIRVIQIAGERTDNLASTTVEIFGRKPEQHRETA